MLNLDRERNNILKIDFYNHQNQLIKIFNWSFRIYDIRQVSFKAQ